MMDGFVLENLLDDDIDMNVIQITITNLSQPLNIALSRSIPRYNEGYIENIVPSYSLSEFKSHFRLSRNGFTRLCSLLAPLLNYRHVAVNLEAKVLFFLWIIAKQESFLAAGDRFGFSRGTGHYIFYNVLEGIIQLKDHYIKWPDRNECTQIQQRVENRCRFPGVVGFIDGCHIAIKQPTNNAVDFFNRKEYHSIILQGVCNDKGMFTDVFIGMPGRMHDARVFRRSPLYDRLTTDPPLLQPHQHILGDAAYPLMQNILKPYRDNGHLSRQEIKFNQTLAGQRQVIERTFGLLKCRWRRLKYLDMSLADKIPEVILAGCILHNFIIIENEDDNYSILEEDNDDVPVVPYEEIEQDIESDASLKRNYISSLLLP